MNAQPSSPPTQAYSPPTFGSGSPFRLNARQDSGSAASSETQYDVHAHAESPSSETSTIVAVDEKEAADYVDDCDDDGDAPAYITAADIARLGASVPYLTGMRALASILIQLIHIGRQDTRYIPFFGFLAVTTHFVQGAFLITGSLLALQERSRKAALGKKHTTFVSRARAQYAHLGMFMCNRWVRLYPAVILVLFFNSIWFVNRYPQGVGHVIKLVVRALGKFTQSNHLLYVSDSYPYSNPFANLWFLDVQEHFYWFWAIVLPFIARFNTKGRIAVLSVLFVLSFRRRVEAGIYNATLPINLYKMVVGAALQLLPLPRKLVLDHAAPAAVIACIATIAWGFSPRFQDFTQKDQRMWSDNLGIIVTVLITLAGVAKAMKRTDPLYVRRQKLAALQRQQEAKEANEHPLVERARNALAAGWSPLDLLDCQTLAFIGRISYSWYLWQVPLMHYEVVFQSMYRGLGPTAEAFVIALMSTFWVEEPLRNAYVAWRKRQSAAAAAGAHSLPTSSAKEV